MINNPVISYERTNSEHYVRLILLLPFDQVTEDKISKLHIMEYNAME
jgi:hypothetical protein